MVDDELIVPYARQGLIGDVYSNARVLSEDYDERGTRRRVRALPAAIERLRHVFADWPFRRRHYSHGCAPGLTRSRTSRRTNSLPSVLGAA